LADGWRYIGSLDDERACAIIQADAIDILVDLSGHTAGNRLPLFTHKPAPIQVTYLGYPDTTGIDAINYRLTDEWADPPGHTEEFHTEKLVHLPDGFLCYQPPRPCPQVSPPPMLRDGIVTFGSFNNLAKVSRTLVGHWAAILTAVPYSRLLLKSKGLSANGSREQMRQQFRDHGINAERIELVGWTSDRIDHMNLYRKVDIALDTFPYNGTTTTCEALWMGVPVMTLAGPVHVSRVGSSLLHAVGLTEMIAQSPSEYVRKAVALAGDTLRLASLRSTLRDRMQASPLTDAQRIAGAVEAAFRNMWQHIC
jgi:predicted O-linked N-acetylglucosamine transferase (SPINDLY family)